MEEVLKDKLSGVVYHPDNTSQWAREISDEIKQSLKMQDMDRYKYVVQVVIGEQRGEGVSMSARCFWDQKRDHYVQKTFQNVSMKAHLLLKSHAEVYFTGNHILCSSCICSLLLLVLLAFDRPFQIIL